MLGKYAGFRPNIELIRLDGKGVGRDAADSRKGSNAVNYRTSIFVSRFPSLYAHLLRLVSSSYLPNYQLFDHHHTPLIKKYLP